MWKKIPYADLQKRRDNVPRWKRANPEKVKAQKQRYRARRAQSPQPPPLPPPPPQGRYNLRSRKVKKIQLMNLVVVLKDYRKEGQCDRNRLLARERNRKYRERNLEKIQAQRKEDYQRDREKIQAQRREHYHRNRDRLLALRRDYLQRNREHVRVQDNKRNRQYRKRNREKIRARKKEEYWQNREKILLRLKVYYQQNREKIRALGNKRNRKYRAKVRQQRNRGEEKEKIDCDCGLCLVCGGFTAASWASKFDDFFEDHEDRQCCSESDTSSLVDPQLVEELERMLNEPSECSELSDEEDELEERLIAIGSHHEQAVQRKLERWKKEQELEESIQYLAGDLGAVNEQV